MKGKNEMSSRNSEMEKLRKEELLRMFRNINNDAADEDSDGIAIQIEKEKHLKRLKL